MGANEIILNITDNHTVVMALHHIAILTQMGELKIKEDDQEDIIRKLNTLIKMYE